MALKIIEVHVASELADDARECLAGLTDQVWTEEGGRFGKIVRAVVGSERSGSALDSLYDDIAKRGPLFVLVESLDAVLPRPHANTPGQVNGRQGTVHTAAAVSREEVYASIADGAKLHRHYLFLVILAATVAAIGLSHDNTAAVIGAMVVAPLLGPNMAIALGLVLGDLVLVRRALVTAGIGFALTLAFATLLGFMLGVDPSTPELASRTQVGIWDLVLALAAGCAGALAFTTGAPTYLTGVMVAVALLPPTVASGMLVSAGELRGAGSALLLAFGNITAVTLAAILTFGLRGMSPRNWWLADRARASTHRGIGIFVGLLAILAGIIVLSN
ncbi:MAG: TIGR00341 family protein [Myxococcales bacterium]|nr:TIGR00341 family protein [Myxococcales bacterium]HIK86476.1 TIGR00341 family protein [Myxococcales bacterium]